MAEKSIILTIGGQFKGEAFKQAQNAIKDLNSNVGKGLSATSKMASALGGLNTGATKAGAAISGLLGVLSAGSLPLMALSAGITAVNFVIGKFSEHAKAAKERLEELKRQEDQAFVGGITERINAVDAEIKRLAENFDLVAKQANAFRAAVEGVRAAGAQGGILKLQTEKLQAMIDAHTEAERQTIEAEYNVRIAAQKRIEAEDAGAQRIADATKAMEQNQGRIDTITNQLYLVIEERQKRELDAANARMRGSEGLDRIDAELAKIKKQQAELEAKRNAAIEDGKVLELNLQKAQQEAANATESATQGVLSAQIAQNRLVESQTARAEAEKAAKESAERTAAANAKALEERKKNAEAEKALKAAKEEEKKQIKEFNDIQKAINDSSRDLAAAQREYADAIDKWIDGGGLAFDAIQQNLKKGNQNWTKAGVLDAATQQALAGQVGAFAVDQALAGGAKTVRDLQRAEREGQRRGRDALSADSGQMTREAKRYERLAKQDRDKLSKADKDFMDKFEKLRNANNEEKKKIADREANIKELATNAKELRKTADEIAKKLDKLGLK